MSGHNYIAEERWRQRVVEGWTAEHDDMMLRGELARAAAAYLLVYVSATSAPRWSALVSPEIDSRKAAELSAELWPFEPDGFKPKDARRNLIRAGALIAAELDRLDRKEGKA